MKNVRNLLAAAVLAAMAACSGDATAPEAPIGRARPSLQTVVSDTTSGPTNGVQEGGDSKAAGSGLIWSGGG
ncbi:hypothetical protein [Longimicrobium sp.]|jgi:uncharacterized protein involved in high-affinity Fe2+ transport|uniref:hypothetical protein n=1 Tax=Longimicrobium sp. TaxID=2029185 RepID=UPI002F94A3F0